MVYYKLIKITYNSPSITKFIINIIIKNHNLSNSIVTDNKYSIYAAMLISPNKIVWLKIRVRKID